MDTCQTSIKTDICFSVPVAHILGLSDRRNITTFGSQRTDLSGEGQTYKTKDLPNTCSRSSAETIMNPIGQNIPVMCLNLETATNNPASFSNREIRKSSDMHVSDHLLFSLRELSSIFQQSVMYLIS